MREPVAVCFAIGSLVSFVCVLSCASRSTQLRIQSQQLAIEAYDGDSLALRDLAELTKSPDEKLRRCATCGLNSAANPSNLPILLEMYEQEPDPAVRSRLLKALVPLSEYDGVRKLARRALASEHGEEAEIAREILASVKQPLPDCVERRLAGQTPRDDWVRDSLYAVLTKGADEKNRRELVVTLCRLGDERMLEYLEKTPSEQFYYGILIRTLSERAASELPVTDRKQIYEMLLSATFSKDSQLRDPSGKQRSLNVPGTESMIEQGAIYLLDDCVRDLPPLEVEGFTIHRLSIWELKRIANHQETVFFHILISRICAYEDYAVVSVDCRPTASIRHPGGFVCGGGSSVLLRKVDNEWRLQKILVNWVS